MPHYRCRTKTPYELAKTPHAECVLPRRHDGWHEDKHDVRWLTFELKPAFGNQGKKLQRDEGTDVL